MAMVNRKNEKSLQQINSTLFVGNIPKNKTKENLFFEFSKISVGLKNVILYYISEDRRFNRGFCFLQFDCQKSAAQTKLKMESINKLWKCKIRVDWADPMKEPSAEVMSTVRVLYVRNLSIRVSEVQIKQLFGEFGKLERVKKIKDYAFVHFDNRESALRAMKKLNGVEIDRITIEVSLAKPPLSFKEKREILRKREERIMNLTNRKEGSNGSKPEEYYSTSKPVEKVQIEQMNTCLEQQIIPMAYYNASFLPNYGYFWNDIWYENPAVYHSYSIPVAKNVIVDPNSMLTNDNSSRLNNVNNEHWEKQQASGDYVKNFVSSN